MMRTLFARLIPISIAVILLGSSGYCQDETDDYDFKPFPVVETGDKVIAPPEGVHPFYKKYINANGVVIVGSENVSDAALIAARRTILHVMGKRPDVNAAMLKNHPRISVMAFSETASDLPEFGARSNGEWGLGQMPGFATSLVSEKGIQYEGNSEYIANFLLHEFVHMVHNLAMPETDPEVVDEIYAAYLEAVENRLFMKPPNEPRANTTPFGAWRDDEYFTHSVNAYYDLNESLPGPWVDIEVGDWGERSGTREALLKNDPTVYKIIEQFFPPTLSASAAAYQTFPYGIQFVHIPGGTFEMGDTFGEGLTNELPVHTVTLADYYLSKTEVTFAQYDAFCEATERRKPGDEGWGRDQMPVINVPWENMNAFCQWLSKETGRDIRLPTEAEWEYAARERGKKQRFGNGKDIADPSEINFDASEDYKESYSRPGVFRARSVPVASFSPNALGLYDMSGNVWEWCSDFDKGNYYKSSPTHNPKGPPTGYFRVFRGGSWRDPPEYCRASVRINHYPGDGYYYHGFRLAMTP